MTKQLQIPQTLPETGFIRLPQVLKIASFSRATLWRRCAAGTFPKPIRLSANISAWRVQEVLAWVDVQGEADIVQLPVDAKKARAWTNHA